MSKLSSFVVLAQTLSPFYLKGSIEIPITETPRGLFLLARSNNASDFTPYLLDMSTRESRLPRFDDDFNAMEDWLDVFTPSAEEEATRISTGLNIAEITHTDPYPTLSIARESSLARQFTDMVLVPDRQTQSSGLRLMVSDNISIPTFANDFCLENELFSVRLSREDGIGFRMTVSLEGFETLTEPQTFGISTTVKTSMVPFQIYHQILNEIVRYSRVLDMEDLNDIDWSPFMHLLPSVEYNVIGLSDNVVGRIVLHPEDYISIRPTGGADLRITPSYGTDPTLGINFIRSVGMFIHHRLNRVFFCEPL